MYLFTYLLNRLFIICIFIIIYICTVCGYKNSTEAQSVYCVYCERWYSIALPSVCVVIYRLSLCWYSILACRWRQDQSSVWCKLCVCHNLCTLVSPFQCFLCTFSHDIVWAVLCCIAGLVVWLVRTVVIPQLQLNYDIFSCACHFFRGVHQQGK